MKHKLFALFLALALTLTTLPVAAEDCTANKVTVLLLSRDALSMAEAASGASVDEFALTEAGATHRAALEAVLDGMLTLAVTEAHCCRAVARLTAGVVGLAVEVDEGDLPHLRAAGDLAPVGARFDVESLTTYAILDEGGEDLPVGDHDALTPDPVVEVRVEAIPAPGSGQVIAILDTGFDLDESWLSLPEHTAPALDGDALTARLALIGQREAVGSAKVPFHYNYVAATADVAGNASHGTRVAALAAANHGDDYDGTAPGAQLLLMKVTGDEEQARAGELALLSAIDDALYLGADVINLSLGSSAGGAGAGIGLARAIAAAQTAGVGVVAAAGNDGEVGAGSFFYSRTGDTLFPTDHVDRGTIASPASLPGVLAVGAAVGSYATGEVLLDESGRRISYSDTCDEFLTLHGIGGRSFADLLGGAAFKYVVVPGYGQAKDYAAVNAVGRVALVKRGEISFAEKTQHAADAGAIGVIVYDNDPATDGAINMQLDGAALPAILINIEDGRRLVEHGAGTLSFPDRDPNSRGMKVHAVSTFSSRGFGDDFSLAPDLMALGENFVGLSVDGYIALLEGSSYAAPQVAGALAALMAEYPLAEAKMRLHNAARSVSDGEADDETPLSLRTQGAGVLDLAAALTAPVTLRGNDGGAHMQVGADRVFEVRFTLTNHTGEAQEVILTPALYADAYFDALGENDPVKRTDATESWLTINGYDRARGRLCVTGHLTPLDATVSLGETVITPTGARLRLDPNEVREVTLTVAIDEATHAAYAAAFPNGYIVEGRIAAQVGGSALSLPVAAYIGDWTAAPIAPATAYEEGEQLWGGMGLETVLVSGYTLELGKMETPDAALNLARLSSDLASVNPAGMAGWLSLEICLLRNVERYTVEVADEAGEVVFRGYGGGMRKAYCPGGVTLAESIPLWDGAVTDNRRLHCPDGVYALTLTLYGTGGGEQVIVLPVTLDATAPTLADASFRAEEGSLMLDLTVADDDYIRQIEVNEKRGKSLGYVVYDTTDILARGRGATATFSLDCTAVWSEYIYVTLTDYAYNTRTIRLDRAALFDASNIGG